MPVRISSTMISAITTPFASEDRLADLDHDREQAAAAQDRDHQSCRRSPSAIGHADRLEFETDLQGLGIQVHAAQGCDQDRDRSAEDQVKERQHEQIIQQIVSGPSGRSRSGQLRPDPAARRPRWRGAGAAAVALAPAVAPVPAEALAPGRARNPTTAGPMRAPTMSAAPASTTSTSTTMSTSTRTSMSMSMSISAAAGIIRSPVRWSSAARWP